jgi:nucleoid DNA-binding protein
MIKIDIVKQVAASLKLKDREALAVVDCIIDSIKQSIKENGRMEIRNFGVFQVKQRKPRTGRNPRNKKEYPIKPRKVVTFKLGKELKDFALAPEPPASPAPQPVGSQPEASPTLFETETKS